MVYPASQSTRTCLELMGISTCLELMPILDKFGHELLAQLRDHVGVCARELAKLGAAVLKRFVKLLHVLLGNGDLARGSRSDELVAQSQKRSEVGRRALDGVRNHALGQLEACTTRRTADRKHEAEGLREEDEPRAPARGPPAVFQPVDPMQPHAQGLVGHDVGGAAEGALVNLHFKKRRAERGSIRPRASRPWLLSRRTCSTRSAISMNHEKICKSQIDFR